MIEQDKLCATILKQRLKKAGKQAIWIQVKRMIYCLQKSVFVRQSECEAVHAIFLIAKRSASINDFYFYRSYNISKPASFHHASNAVAKCPLSDRRAANQACFAWQRQHRFILPNADRTCQKGRGITLKRGPFVYVLDISGSFKISSQLSVAHQLWHRYKWD